MIKIHILIQDNNKHYSLHFIQYYLYQRADHSKCKRIPLYNSLLSIERVLAITVDQTLENSSQIWAISQGCHLMTCSEQLIKKNKVQIN